MPLIAVNTIQLITHLMIIDSLNAVNNSNFLPTIKEKLFGIMSDPTDKTLLKKFNYIRPCL